MTRSNVRGLISIVTPLYDEQENIAELVSRLRDVFDANPTYDFEVIAVDNGSRDRTFDLMVAANAEDSRFKVVKLSRNFGADGGITAGLSYAKGDAAVLMSGDLQDPPELINDFIKAWEEGYENVYQIVTRREGTGWARRVSSQAFYWLINKMTGGLFPRNVSDFRLVDRKVYCTINSMHERNRLIRGMFFWSGFKSTGIECPRPARFAGESKADTRHVLGLAVKGILSYSYLPLRMITYAGSVLSFCSFAFLIYVVIVRLFTQEVPFSGFATIVGVMLLMFGFLLTGLGIVAEYIGLIYEEVRQRPNYVISEEVGV